MAQHDMALAISTIHLMKDSVPDCGISKTFHT